VPHPIERGVIGVLGAIASQCGGVHDILSCGHLTHHHVNPHANVQGLQPPEATCSSPEERLPRQYRRVPSGDEGGDDDVAAAAAAGAWVAAVAASGPSDTTAAAGAVHPATEAGVAAAQEPRLPPRQQQQQQGVEAGAPGDWGYEQKEGHLVEHLPPANGTEDVYTLLKLYTVSSQLVSNTSPCSIARTCLDEQF